MDKIGQKSMAFLLLAGFIFLGIAVLGPDDSIKRGEGVASPVSSGDAGLNFTARIFAGQPVVKLNGPLGVAVSRTGEVYVADSANNRVLVFREDGEPARVIGRAGRGKGEFNYPAALAVDGQGRLFVADLKNDRIQAFDREGRFQEIWPNDGVFRRLGAIRPAAVALDRYGNVYVGDHLAHRVLVFDARGGFIRQLGVYGSGPGQLHFPNGIAVDNRRGFVYIADSNNSRIQVFDQRGKFIRSIDSPGPKGKLVLPRGLALDEGRNLLYIADTLTHRVFVRDLAHNKATVLGGQGYGPGRFNFPNGLAIRDNGELYVADRGNNRIQVLKEGGQVD